MSTRGLRNAEHADFASRQQAQDQSAEALVWPVEVSLISRVGDSVTRDRNGHGRPHEGVDLFVPAGTAVVSATSGVVKSVRDGRFSSSPRLRRAGLFVEVLGPEARVYRYLHLGGVQVRSGEALARGETLGSVAPAHTSGLGEAPHLHFEIRAQASGQQTYGAPLDPLTLLPMRRS